VANPIPAKGFSGQSIPDTSTIDGKVIEQTLGYPGQSNNGMFKVVIGRRTTMPCGCDATKEMGVNTWAAFAGSSENAIVDGDFAVLERASYSRAPVLRSRHQCRDHLTMTDEKPRILFILLEGSLIMAGVYPRRPKKPRIIRQGQSIRPHRNFVAVYILNAVSLQILTIHV
jgi:hypothetical protein